MCSDSCDHPNAVQAVPLKYPSVLRADSRQVHETVSTRFLEVDPKVDVSQLYNDEGGDEIVVVRSHSVDTQVNATNEDSPGFNIGWDSKNWSHDSCHQCGIRDVSPSSNSAIAHDRGQRPKREASPFCCSTCSKATVEREVQGSQEPLIHSKKVDPSADICCETKTNSAVRLSHVRSSMLFAPSQPKQGSGSMLLANDVPARLSTKQKSSAHVLRRVSPQPSPLPPPPIYFIGGWYDFFLNQQLEDYQNAKVLQPHTRLLIGPFAHWSLSMLNIAMGEVKPTSSIDA